MSGTPASLYPVDAACLCACALRRRLPRGLKHMLHAVHAGYFSREQAPNVLLTTCYRPSRLMYHFLADMLEVLPCATFYKRQVCERPGLLCTLSTPPPAALALCMLAVCPPRMAKMAAVVCDCGLKGHSGAAHAACMTRLPEAGGELPGRG